MHVVMTLFHPMHKCAVCYIHDRPSSSTSSSSSALLAIASLNSIAGSCFRPCEVLPGQAAADVRTIDGGASSTVDIGVGGATAAAAATEWFIKATSRRSSSSALACSDARKRYSIKFDNYLGQQSPQKEENITHSKTRNQSLNYNEQIQISGSKASF